MNKLSALILIVVCVISTLASEVRAGSGPVSLEQNQEERANRAVVRHKQFYKKDRFELSADGGLVPYDSLVNQYMVGGRLTWHIADHWGWEILDGQVAFPNVTNYATDLARDKGISNMQTSELRTLLGTNLLVSPIYGKFKFIGQQVLYFDFYITAGFGMARIDTVKLSSPGKTLAATQSIVRSAWDPYGNLGVGFKVFINPSFGLMLDLRDYIVYTDFYGTKTLKSNYSAFFGICLFLPSLG